MSKSPATLAAVRSAAVAGRYRFRSLQSFIGLALVLLIALLTSPRTSGGGPVFLQAGNITDIFRQVSEIGIISLGMTFVILSGGIDLSVGTTLALSASVVALILTRLSIAGGALWQIVLAVVVAIASSAIAGLIDGLVIAKLKIQPFIVTLSAMIGIRGLARWMTNNNNIDIGFGEDVASRFARVLSFKSVVVGSYLVLAIVLGVLLSKTIFGRYVRAVGDNEKAELYAGLPIVQIKVLVYGMAGLLAGYAGVLHAAQNHQGSPNAGITYELDAIAAVVIGGASLAGGRGTIGGTVVGTMTVGVLTNMLRLNNVDSNVELMIKALIIVGAVWIQQRGSEQR